MARPRTDLGHWGKVNTAETGAGWKAETYIRDDDGQRRRVLRTGPTETKARKALMTALLNRQAPVRGATLTPQSELKEAAELWWVDVITPSALKENTKRVYADVMRLHVTEGSLGHVPVSKLTVATVEAKLRQTGARSGPGAMKLVRTVLRGVLDNAVKHRAIPVNPVRLAAPISVQPKPSSGTRSKDSRRALSPSERQALLDFMDTDPKALMYDLSDLTALMAATGCRIGEACALRWDRVDLPEATATIDSTVVRIKGQGSMIQETTKSQSGKRLVHLPQWVVGRLEARLLVGPANDWNVVFPSPLGMLRDPSNTLHRLREAFDAAGFEWMTSHTLRRTAATWMDDAGFTPREIANQLGHARVSLTQDVYMDRRRSVERAKDVL